MMTEIQTYYLRNLDYNFENPDLTALEKAPPAQAYYNLADQLRDYVFAKVRGKLKAWEERKADISTRQQIEERQQLLRARFIQSCGGLLPWGGPVPAQLTGTLPRDGYKIEKLILETQKNVFVTANMYIPDGLQGKTGAVLFVCGHAEPAKAFVEYQNVCINLAKAGLVALAIDPIGQGERFSYIEKDGTQSVRWGCPEHDHVGFQSLNLDGGTAKFFLNDAMRAIDYLQSRPEVDPEKIGVTGNSGGGTQTSLLMLADPRIAAAAPGTFLTDADSIMTSCLVQDVEQIWPGMTEIGFDHSDILLMLSPKPVMVLAVAYDFFPIEGTRRTCQLAQKYWDICGLGGNFELVVDASDHQYTDFLAKKSTAFFAKHLLGKTVDLQDYSGLILPEAELNCTSSGQVRLDFENAEFIYEQNLKTLAGLGKRDKAAAKEWLKTKILQNRTPCDFNIRRFEPLDVDGIKTESLLWWADKDLFGTGLLFNSDKNAKLNIAIFENGCTDLNAHGQFILGKCAAGESVLVLDLCGSGALMPNRLNTQPMHGFEGTMCKLALDLIWLDDSLAALRAHNVYRAYEMAAQCLGYGQIALYSHGRFGLYALMAKFALDLPVELDCQALDFSYANIAADRFYDPTDIFSYTIPHVLQHLDVAEMLAIDN